MTQTRATTRIDMLADSYLDEYAALDPTAATFWGLPGHDTELPDLSPAWHEQLSGLRRRTLAALDTTAPQDDTDHVTAAALREELDVAEQIYATGDDEARLNNIASPVQNVRTVFDLMATATADDWAVIATRLAAVPAAMDGYVASLRHAASRGHVVAQRQVRAGVTQCAESGEFFEKLARDAALEDGGELPAAVRADVERGAQSAAEAYRQLGAFLGDELLPQAPEADAVGAERYALYSRAFLGTSVDLAETYEWGQAELARLVANMETTAAEIKPGATVAEAMEHLDSDPARRLHGTDALRAWMQERSDEAVAALADTHFDIPEPIRTLECRIAPTPSGGIYYTGPSDDFSRPGRMWWAVPAGVTSFSTWRELTTVYHEGVPGHHLQIGQTVYRRAMLNRWRRLASWVSGHGEGWALYAERLMADLGFLDDPGNLLGMLDGQAMRAARVVLDIGVHCGFDAPAEVGGGAWTYEKAWQFLVAHSAMAEGFLRFELDRYLGWPGQAPSYKVGERFWLQLREEARRRAGDGFDLKAFHRQALDVGSVGLDVLRDAVLAA